MYKLVLISFLIATLVIPLSAARDKNHRRGLKKALVLLIAFAIVYLAALLWLFPRLYYPVT
jgi:hypothetical protein